MGGLAPRAGVIGPGGLKPGAYRLRVEANGCVRSLVLKRLEPGVAQRNQLVAKRWLPALGLSEAGPPLLRLAAERNGERVWHVHHDPGDCTLDGRGADPRGVRAAGD